MTLHTSLLHNIHNRPLATPHSSELSSSPAQSIRPDLGHVTPLEGTPAGQRQPAGGQPAPSPARNAWQREGEGGF